MDKRELGDKIAALLFREYNKLKKSNKPIKKSNGIKEWTIISGIVAVSNKDTNIIKVISLATGVKATPDSELKRSQGSIVHDCHAEILAIRGFNTTLLREIENKEIDDTNSCDLIYKVENSKCKKYSWNDEYDLGLYISKLPCGDSSMEEENSLESNSLIQFQENDLTQYVDPTIRTILRGRINYNKSGCVRTKPGRIDSEITFSKSCSDKICIKQVLSLLNSLNTELLESPIYIKYLVCPDIKPQNLILLKKSFNRIENIKLEVSSSYRYHPLSFIPSSIQFQDGKTNDLQEPSFTSVVKIFNSNDKFGLEQSIVNGVKMGAYTKKSKPLSKNAMTIVSRTFQWNIFKNIMPEFEQYSYLTFKRFQTDRIETRNRIRKCLSQDGWISTFNDDII
ncbi:hypothetical protein TBLA_0E00230 [Henningerozyma blattae CBS 6284]|uniref:A to I editase domain-containing protein n=1 Tax=Henningerozyma blattae (strain ATCC 34711 / CBS 6284 / DSM 70876 / NBRC 10599 / NRRL Y-10934 / UCD 77-7) TaxID=1071380 RepID=I2H3Y3_HENB6|nr:hypothetical protein TBLA_0E00230 [Tetrapisispora blattae CBS 6284]CCH61085.1 hypothetical protein TBLA_0E00230 [Tetrapisispora blattae CBS 6284]